MDDGIIASRYADALLKYVLETGCGDRVLSQATRLEEAIARVPDLAAVLETPEEISDEAKISLLVTALGGSMEPALDRFIRLVFENRRIPLLRLMLRDFVLRYRRRQGVVKGRLRVVSEPPAALLNRLRSLVREKTGYDVEIETVLDPSLIGGFVFDIDDWLLDASVIRQLDLIRSQFVDNNRRIV